MIGGKFASAVQDAIVTSRDGRYVIPIKAEARNQVLSERVAEAKRRLDALVARLPESTV